MATKEKDQTERTFEKKLPVQLTDDEERQKGKALARTLAEMRAENDKKKDISDRIKKLKEKAEKLEGCLTSGVEERQVEVKEICDWKRKRVILTRLDTGETVEDRPMNAEEVQKPLSLSPGQGKVKDEKDRDGDKKPAAPAKPTLIKGGKSNKGDDGKDGE